jgi:hypothetical protein
MFIHCAAFMSDHGISHVPLRIMRSGFSEVIIFLSVDISSEKSLSISAREI